MRVQIVWLVVLLAVVAVTLVVAVAAREHAHTRWHHAVMMAPTAVILVQNTVHPTVFAAIICFVFGVAAAFWHRQWLRLRYVHAKRREAGEAFEYLMEILQRNDDLWPPR